MIIIMIIIIISITISFLIFIKILIIKFKSTVILIIIVILLSIINGPIFKSIKWLMKFLNFIDHHLSFIIPRVILFKYSFSLNHIINIIIYLNYQILNNLKK